MSDPSSAPSSPDHPAKTDDPPAPQPPSNVLNVQAQMVGPDGQKIASLGVSMPASHGNVQIFIGETVPRPSSSSSSNSTPPSSEENLLKGLNDLSCSSPAASTMGTSKTPSLPTTDLEDRTSASVTPSSEASSPVVAMSDDQMIKAVVQMTRQQPASLDVQPSSRSIPPMEVDSESPKDSSDDSGGKPKEPEVLKPNVPHLPPIPAPPAVNPAPEKPPAPKAQLPPIPGATVQPSQPFKSPLTVLPPVGKSGSPQSPKSPKGGITPGSEVDESSVSSTTGSGKGAAKADTPGAEADVSSLSEVSTSPRTKKFVHKAAQRTGSASTPEDNKGGLTRTETLDDVPSIRGDRLAASHPLITRMLNQASAPLPKERTPLSEAKANGFPPENMDSPCGTKHYNPPTLCAAAQKAVGVSDGPAVQSEPRQESEVVANEGDLSTSTSEQSSTDPAREFNQAIAAAARRESSSGRGSESSIPTESLSTGGEARLGKYQNWLEGTTAEARHGSEEGESSRSEEVSESSGVFREDPGDVFVTSSEGGRMLGVITEKGESTGRSISGSLSSDKVYSDIADTRVEGKAEDDSESFSDSLDKSKGGEKSEDDVEMEDLEKERSGKLPETVGKDSATLDGKTPAPKTGLVVKLEDETPRTPKRKREPKTSSEKSPADLEAKSPGDEALVSSSKKYCLESQQPEIGDRIPRSSTSSESIVGDEVIKTEQAPDSKKYEKSGDVDSKSKDGIEEDEKKGDDQKEPST